MQLLVQLHHIICVSGKGTLAAPTCSTVAFSTHRACTHYANTCMDGQGMIHLSSHACATQTHWYRYAHTFTFADSAFLAIYVYRSTPRQSHATHLCHHWRVCMLLVHPTACGVNAIIMHALGLRIWMWSVDVRCIFSCRCVCTYVLVWVWDV